MQIASWSRSTSLGPRISYANVNVVDSLIPPAVKLRPKSLGMSVPTPSHPCCDRCAIADRCASTLLIKFRLNKATLCPNPTTPTPFLLLHSSNQQLTAETDTDTDSNSGTLDTLSSYRGRATKIQARPLPPSARIRKITLPTIMLTHQNPVHMSRFSRPQQHPRQPNKHLSHTIIINHLITH